MRYAAFLSYRHETLPRFVKQFELALKTYAKPLLEPPLKIFRDENHLVPGIDLSALIQSALAESEFLILLASPEAAKSSWVRQELAYWCGDLRRSEKLIIVLLAGTMEMTEAGGVDWGQTDALPATLEPYIKSMPLYVDMRWARKDESVDLAHSDFRQAINVIVARLRGRDPNDLSGVEVRQHRRNLRLRNGAVALLTIATLASLGGFGVATRQRQVAINERNQAEAQRVAAVMTTAAMEMEQGRFLDAAKRSQADMGLPATFRDNVALSLLDGGAIVDAAADFVKEDLDEFDVDRLQLSSDGNVLAALGWYNGIHTIDLERGNHIASCGQPSRFSLFSLSPSGRSLGWEDQDSVSYATVDDCEVLSRLEYPAKTDGRGRITTVAATDSSSPILFGDELGRVFRIEGEEARLVYTAPAGIDAVIPIPTGQRMAILSGARRLALIDETGSEVAPALQLAVGTIVSDTTPAWADFVRALRRRDRATIVAMPLGGGGYIQHKKESVLALDASSRATMIAFMEDEHILAARIGTALNDGCSGVEWITRDSWHRREIDKSCNPSTDLLKMSLPVSAAAAAFCGPDYPFVIGSEDGEVVWARVTGESRVTLEHVERSWPDSVTAVACTDSGTAYAGFRASGVRRFQYRFRVTTERMADEPEPGRQPNVLPEAGEAHSKPDVQPDDDSTIDRTLQHPVRGATTVRLYVESGVMELGGSEGTLWRRQVAKTEPYRTGSWIDQVEGFMVDEERSRVWVLRSFGEMMLIDLHTGGVLVTLGTNMLTAAPATFRELLGLDLDPKTGEPQVIHTDGTVRWKVRVLGPGSQ